MADKIRGSASPKNTVRDAEALERQRVLGARLKKMFDHVIDEDVPDDFNDLLNKLDDSDGKGG